MHLCPGAHPLDAAAARVRHGGYRESTPFNRLDQTQFVERGQYRPDILLQVGIVWQIQELGDTGGKMRGANSARYYSLQYLPRDDVKEMRVAGERIKYRVFSIPTTNRDRTFSADSPQTGRGGLGHTGHQPPGRPLASTGSEHQIRIE